MLSERKLFNKIKNLKHLSASLKEAEVSRHPHILAAIVQPQIIEEITKCPESLEALFDFLTEENRVALDRALFQCPYFKERIYESAEIFKKFIPFLLKYPQLQFLVIEHLQKDEQAFKTYIIASTLSIFYLKSALKDFQNFIAAKFKINPSIFNNSLSTAAEFKLLLDILPSLKKELIAHVCANSELIWRIFSIQTTSLNFNSKAAKLFSRNEIIEIARNLINTSHPTAQLLKPLIFVNPQDGPNCPYTALHGASAHLKDKSPHTLFALNPARKRDQPKAQQSLRQIAKHKINIEGPGGILDIHQFKALVEQTNLIAKVLKIEGILGEQTFIDTLCIAIKLGIPVILPYDTSETKNSAYPHYCVVTGYARNKTSIEFLMVENGKYQFMQSTALFERNVCLDVYPEKRFFKVFNKAGTKKDYVSPLPMRSCELFGSYTYPKTDLKQTLRERMLLVLTPEMAEELKDNASYQKLLAYEENRLHLENKKTA